MTGWKEDSALEAELERYGASMETVILARIAASGLNPTPKLVWAIMNKMLESAEHWERLNEIYRKYDVRKE